jgi:hypothetical protein
MRGQSLPPLEAGATTERPRCLVDAPHEFEHAPHALHADATQSTGHACVLQLL